MDQSNRECIEPSDPLELNIQPGPTAGAPHTPAHIKWKHVDGPMLVTTHGSCHWLGLWEILGLRAGFITLASLDKKYERYDEDGFPLQSQA